MEANAVIVAAISVVAKVNPMLPSGLKQMNNPDMVGKDLWRMGGPHYVQIQNKHAFPPYGLPPNYTPPNVAYTPSENVNNSTPILIESWQPQTDHAHVSQTMRTQANQPLFFFFKRQKTKSSKQTFMITELLKWFINSKLEAIPASHPLQKWLSLLFFHQKTLYFSTYVTISPL